MVIKASGHVLIREAREDAILTIPNPEGEEGNGSIPVAKGTQVSTAIFGALGPILSLIILNMFLDCC